MRLSVPEVRHLLTRLLWHGKHSLQHVLDWSNWRRAHQLLAIFYHTENANPPCLIASSSSYLIAIYNCSIRSCLKTREGTWEGICEGVGSDSVEGCIRVI